MMPQLEIPQKLRERREVTLVVDALLGTGLTGPPTGRVLELIRAVQEFPEAKVVAVDLPSGLGRRRRVRAREHDGDVHCAQSGALPGGRRRRERRTAGGYADRLSSATGSLGAGAFAASGVRAIVRTSQEERV